MSLLLLVSSKLEKQEELDEVGYDFSLKIWCYYFVVVDIKFQSHFYFFFHLI